LESLNALAPETVPLACALGRIVAEPLVAHTDLPQFDNSAMDGYAVRVDDVAAATPDQPAKLRLLGQVAAGEEFSLALAENTCVRLYTGSPLPAGADAVVMQEDTRSDPADPATVWILEPARPWENVRLRGEDVNNGTIITQKGERLTSGRVSLLAACGLAKITVARPPIVGIVATGSELYEPGESLGPGGIYESNRLSLAALVRSVGGTPQIYPLLKDAESATIAILNKAFGECDAVVTCGGVSVGDFDLVKGCFEKLGGRQHFWRVAMKPGRPFVFGHYQGKPLFGLPGNPVSAFVTGLLLVRPAILKMQGAGDLSLPSHPGWLAEALVNNGDRRHFMRVVVDARGQVRSAGLQAAHGLAALAHANGLVDVPPNTSYDQGTQVTVLRWE
jgi:molybdopterin molybdotransferase